MVRRVERVSVSVPASSANLGPGYDCLGVALPLRSELEVVRRGFAPLSVVVEGEGAAVLPLDATNLVVQAFARVWERPLDGLSFRLVNRVPMRAGTGSSSAAIVAGLAAALALDGRAYGPAELLPLAVEIEGHPDNVAAAIHGGFTLSLTDPPHACRIEPPAGLAFVLAMPTDTLCTTESRKALRPHLPRADAVFSLQRTALLVHALGTGRLDLLGHALDDRMHEPDRAPLVPLFATLQPLAGSPGCLGVTLSGAGPSVLVWALTDEVAAVEASVRRLCGDSQVTVLAPEPRGVLVS